MKLVTGIFDHPTTDDDDDERKRPKDGCPTPWKHCWTRHVSWSWTRPRNLDGTARPLAVHCHASKNCVWGSPVVCGPRVFSSCPHFSTYGQSYPWELGRSTTETTDFGSQDPELVALVLVRFALDDQLLLARLEGSCSVSSGAWISTESSMASRSLAFFAAVAALCRVFWALAFAWAAQASGSQSVQTRQGLSWVQSGCPSFKRHCWQRKWLSFLLQKWEYPGNLGWDSAEDDRSCDRSTILSMQVRLDEEVNMASHANLHAQRSTWDQLISLHGQPKLSSFFVFDNAWKGHWDSAWIGLTSVHERGENRSERLADVVLCASAAAHGPIRGLNFIVWNFAWDRLASRLYAATATTFLMKKVITLCLISIPSHFPNLSFPKTLRSYL